MTSDPPPPSEERPGPDQKRLRIDLKPLERPGKVQVHPETDEIDGKQKPTWSPLKPSPNSPKISPMGFDDSEASTLPDACEKDSLLHILTENRAVSAFMTCLVMWSLFCDDIRLLCTDKSADDGFYAVVMFMLIVFAVEFGMLNWLKPKYTFGFYFWLDLVATLSLIPDVGWIWDDVQGGGDIGGTMDDSSMSGMEQQAALKTSRVSRIGSRASRIVRIIRVIRLIRIAKLFRRPQVSKADPETQTQSEISTTLVEMITQRVVICVLMMLIGIPIVELAEMTTSAGVVLQENGLQQLHEYQQMPTVHVDAFRFQTEFYGKNVGSEVGSLLQVNMCVGGADSGCPHAETYGALVKSWLEAAGHQLFNRDHIRSTYRAIEVSQIVVHGCFGENATADSVCISEAIFDVSSDSRNSAGVNMLRTIFVLVVLCHSVIHFTRAAERIVIGPIEAMVASITKFTKSPIAALLDDHDDDGEEDEGSSRRNSRSRLFANRIKKMEQVKLAESGSYETRLLQDVLSKTAQLLSLGFGEAGAAIIKQNLTANAELNPLLPGVKVYAVFGFCDIRRFTDTTECLQEDVMVFVNKIATIVHDVCHAYGGSANKNIGDAFLLAWKVDKPKTDMKKKILKKQKSEIKGDFSKFQRRRRNSDLRTLGDIRGDEVAREKVSNALMAFLRTILTIEKSNKEVRGLGYYAQHPSIKARFGNNFEVKLGYGLHIGWSIEGAIGSMHKIDATYLSPHVNMAARLEAATKQFGVPLLFSSDFYQCLPEEATKRCRHIDTVTVKGSAQPMGIYTFDIVPKDKISTVTDNILGGGNKLFTWGRDSVSNITDVEALSQSMGGGGATKMVRAVRKTVIGGGGRMSESAVEDSILCVGLKLTADFKYDPLVPQLQAGLPEAFLKTWQEAIAMYTVGDWKTAKEKLEVVLELMPHDGPAERMMSVIQASNFVPPGDWAGFRCLDEK
jgi:class 3 adenylate cyclase